MIRIYLDWNVISNLKRPENKELKDFIETNKKSLLFPYSPSHFSDLMKSYSPENEFFQIDLETLERLSGKHLLRWEENRTALLFGTPKEYFEGEKNQEDIFSFMDMEKLFSEIDEMVNIPGMGTIMKSLYKLQPAGIEVNNQNREILKKMFPSISPTSSKWDLMKDFLPLTKNLLQNKDYYKDLRKTIGDQGFKVHSNSGNWSEEDVIKNIDAFLKEAGLEMTFIDYVKTTFEHRNEPINRYDLFTTAYLMLDMIGYKTDKLPKPTDNMQNITTDGEHAFYAAHCDFFIVGDKKLKIKTKALYNKFNITTKVLSPSEFKNSVEDVRHEIGINNFNFINDAFNQIKGENVIEFYPITEDYKVESHVIKLPIFHFNFFNYLITDYDPEKRITVLTYKKVFRNYGNYIYYTESENLIDRITNFFGFDDLVELAKIKKDFVYESKDVQFSWNFNGGEIILEKDPETNLPILKYIFIPNSSLEDVKTNDEITPTSSDEVEKQNQDTDQNPSIKNDYQEKLKIEALSNDQVFNQISNLDIDNLTAFLDYKFQDRKKSAQDISTLLEALLENAITFKDIEDGYNKSINLIKEQLEREKSIYNQSGIIRVILNLTNDRYWNYTRSKSIDKYSAWVEKMEILREKIKNSD